MTADELADQLCDANRLPVDRHRIGDTGHRLAPLAPWPVLVRLPDGTTVQVTRVTPTPLAVILEAEPCRPR